MTEQAKKVEEAVNLLHTNYKKAHDSILAREEKTHQVTITVNSIELEMLRTMVTDMISKEHGTWFDVSNDESINVYDMAYEFAGSVLREDRLHRLYSKLALDSHGKMNQGVE